MKDAVRRFVDTYQRVVDAAWPVVGSRLGIGIGIGLFVVVVLTFFPCHYAVNDDIAIVLDLQDGLDVSFFGLTLGRVISWLYAHIARAVPWYTIALLVAHAVSLYCFLASLLASRQLRCLWPPFVVFYLTVYLRFLWHINYTSTAMMAGVQSTLAFLVLLARPRPSLRPAAGLGIVFAGSYLIRAHSWLVVLLFVLPLVLQHLVLHRAHARYWAAFLAPAAIALCVQTALARWTVTSEYRDFQERLQLLHRPGFYMPGVPLPNGVLEGNGWSLLDYELLKSYFFADEERFSTPHLRRLADASTRDLVRNWRSRLVLAPTALVADLETFAGALTALLVAGGMVLPRRSTIFLACYTAYGLSAMAGLVAFFYLPAAVGVPLWLLLVGAPAAAMFSTTPSSPTRLSLATGIAAAGLACSTVCLAAPLRSAVEEDALGKRAFESDLATLNARCHGAVVAWVCCGLFPEYWDSRAVVRPQFTFLLNGWPTFSPRYRQILRQRLLVGDAQLLPAMVGNRWAFLLTTRSYARRLRRYLRDSLGQEAELVRVETLANGELYQLRR